MQEDRLGRIETVALRSIFEDEARDFSPWLARENNLELLGESVGLDLQLEDEPKEVGGFEADVLCKETVTESWVLIENQLERTDHRHLGQVLTYAAGLDAVAIIWIARHFTEEHQAAVDWLNEVTNQDANFFGVEVELLKIADSPPAPSFNVISEPNEWRRSVSEAAKRSSDEQLTEDKKLQRDFWQEFREYLRERDTPLKAGTPRPGNKMTMGIGRGGFRLAAIASRYDSELESYERDELRAEVAMWRENAPQAYQKLFRNKAEIEDELKFGDLTWYAPDDQRKRRIYFREPVDLEDRDSWSEYCDWLKARLEALHEVFAPRIQRLDLSKATPEVS